MSFVNVTKLNTISLKLPAKFFSLFRSENTVLGDIRFVITFVLLVSNLVSPALILASWPYFVLV